MYTCYDIYTYASVARVVLADEDGVLKPFFVVGVSMGIVEGFMRFCDDDGSFAFFFLVC